MSQTRVFNCQGYRDLGDDTLFDDPCVAIEVTTCLLQWVSLRKLHLCKCGLTSSTLAVISLGIRSRCHQLECSTAKARDLGDDTLFDDPCVAIEVTRCLLQWVSLRKLHLCKCGLTSSTLAVISLGIRSGCHQLECSTARATETWVMTLTTQHVTDITSGRG